MTPGSWLPSALCSTLELLGWWCGSPHHLGRKLGGGALPLTTRLLSCQKGGNCLWQDVLAVRMCSLCSLGLSVGGGCVFSFAIQRTGGSPLAITRDFRQPRRGRGFRANCPVTCLPAQEAPTAQGCTVATEQALRLRTPPRTHCSWDVGHGPLCVFIRKEKTLRLSGSMSDVSLLK